MEDDIEPFAIEPIGHGFMAVDYTGSRGRFGAAYAGKDGAWHDQPISVRDPFDTREAAEDWARRQSYS
jgi:hypothetical protein